MIQAEEAIRAARGLIGTAYSELDCNQPRQEGHPHSAERRQALHDGGDERPVGQRQQERQIPRFDMEAGGHFRREAGDAGVHGRWHG